MWRIPAILLVCVSLLMAGSWKAGTPGPGDLNKYFPFLLTVWVSLVRSWLSELGCDRPSIAGHDFISQKMRKDKATIGEFARGPLIRQGNGVSDRPHWPQGLLSCREWLAWIGCKLSPVAFIRLTGTGLCQTPLVAYLQTYSEKILSGWVPLFTGEFKNINSDQEICWWGLCWTGRSQILHVVCENYKVWENRYT